MKRNIVPDFGQRQKESAQAKKAMLEKFRAAPGPDDPAVAERQAAREKVVSERLTRAAKREAEKIAHEAELAARAARDAQLAAQAEREAADLSARAKADQDERDAALRAEQKTARDQRYAQRKAAKKQRRKEFYS
jgi:Family of unknown function (DUF6481)